MKRLSQIVVFAPLIGLSLWACAKPAPVEANAAQSHTHDPSDPNAHFHGDYQSHSHGAAVAFTYEKVEALELGETGGGDVSVSEDYPSGELLLEAIDTAGVTVFGATKTLRIDMADGDTHAWRVDLQADRPGTYYVGLIATTAPGEDYSEAHTSAIRVDVIDPNPASFSANSSPSNMTTSDGQPAVILEAEETIRTTP